jgi:hypothetical protein
VEADNISGNSIFAFGMDIPIKLTFKVENYNNSNILKDVCIKWEPKVYDKNGNIVSATVVAAT